MNKTISRWLTFIFSLFIMATAIAGPSRTTYQARIIKPDGQPLEATNVNFKFTILDPSASCVLYVENYSAVNMADTAGLISFTLGSGARTFPSSGTLSSVFDNSTVSFPCQAPGIYNPTTVDARKLMMQFQDSSGWQTLPAQTINAVPYAMYANKADDSIKLNGKSDTAFVERSLLPSCQSGEALRFNGASFSCVTVGGASSSGLTSLTVSGSVLVNTGTASAPVLSVTKATVSSDGYVTSVDYAEFKTKLAASSTQIINTLGYVPVSLTQVVQQIASHTLAGDVSGTLSANTVVSVGGKTASQIATSVTQTQSASSANVVSTLVQRDSLGNFVTNDIFANSTKINYLDIFKPSTNLSIRLQAPASLAASYTLTLPVTSGTLNQVLTTDGAGQLIWSNPSSSGINGVSVTLTSLTTNDILQYNGSGFVNRTIPTCAASEYLTFNGTAYSCAVDSGSAGTITTVNGTAGQITASGTSTVTLSLTDVVASATVGSANAIPSFTFDSKGRITAATSNAYQDATGAAKGVVQVGSNITVSTGTISVTSANVISALGFTPADSATSGNYLTTANNLSDLASATVARTNLGLGSISVLNSIDLATNVTGILPDANIVNIGSGVTSGTQYTKVTVDDKGRVTSGAQLSSTDVTSALGFTPANAASATQWLASGTAIYYSTGNVGIGTSNPTTSLQIVTSGAVASFDRFAGTVTLNLRRANNVVGAPTALSTGDEIGRIAAFGHNGTSYGNVAASIRFYTDENFTTNNNGTNIRFYTTSIASSATAEAARINNAGYLGLAVTNPTARLHIASGTTAVAPLRFTSGTLLASPQTGAMEYDGAQFYLTDSTSTRRAIATGSAAGTIDNASAINSTGNIVMTPVGSVIVSSTTASTNSTTGALIVRGGVGIAGDLYSSGTITTTSTIQGASITATSGMISPYIYGSTAVSGNLTLDSTTNATKGYISLAPNGGGVAIGVSSTNIGVKLQVNDIFAKVQTQAVDGTGSFAAFQALSNNAINNVEMIQYPTSTTGNYLGFARANNSFIGASPVSAFAVGTKNTTPLVLATSGTEKLRIDSSGNVGIGTTTPTARLHLASGTTTTASLKITSGALLSSPADGAIEYDGSNLYYTDSTNTRRTLANSSGSQTNSGNNTYTGINTFSGVVNVSNNTASTNSTTGAFVVSGGVGVGGAINVAGNANVSGAITTSSNITATGFVSATTYIAGLGSAASPSYTFNGNTITGLFSPATNVVALSTSGTERFRIDTNGNVGVGTTSPNSKFVVTYDSTTSGVASATITSDAPGSTSSDYALYLRARTGTGTVSNVMVVRGDGNVGIGTATPSTLLHVSGTGSLIFDRFGAGQSVQQRRANGVVGSPTVINGGEEMGRNNFSGYQGGGYSVGGASVRAYAEETFDSTHNGSNIRFYTTPLVSVSQTEAMRITASGSVGIGTTAPAGALDVSGTSIYRGIASLLPYGTAAGNTSDLRFNELASNGSNYIALKSADNLSSNVSFTLPSVSGTVGQVLSTDGAGVLSWVTAATPAGYVAKAGDIMTGGLNINTASATAFAINTSVFVVSGTNVSVGSSNPSSGTKLNVEGQIRSKSFSTTSGSIDWSNGNSGTTSYDCASPIDMQNIRDGGSYTLVVTGTGTTQCSFSTSVTGDDAGTVTYRFNPINASRTASSHSIYSLMRIGSIVYVSWITNF